VPARKAGDLIANDSGEKFARLSGAPKANRSTIAFRFLVAAANKPELLFKKAFVDFGITAPGRVQ
jgi:hypothetical protein